ncbi:MAG TPA: hypothetical protein VM386_03360 [Acidimicrobiales bacterium]|nr:hypothetical protein [Acidimicrobiales bacterium]
MIASTSPRTLETAIAMGCAVDELLEVPSPAGTGEVEFHEWRQWESPIITFQQRADTSRALADHVTGQAERVLAAAASIEDGGPLLVVGHGGWVEAVTAGLIDPEAAATVGGSFWHLDGVRLTLTDDWRASVASVPRFPQPGRLQDGSFPPGEPPASRADAPVGVGTPPRRQTHSTVRNGRRLVWYAESL